jgi:2-amino-4-hydroxy-6-hydroxymethyldihydropteridine diphosphokinase
MSGAESVVAYLGLGSNIGDRAAELRKAYDRISVLPETQLLRVSPLYETDPWGYHEQDAFLNSVAEVRTSLTPFALFQSLKNIERAMGRTPSERNHPRIIDIDLLLSGATVLDHPTLRIPHPGIPERRFVLQPLCDLAPDLDHPVLHVPIHELLARCTDSGVVRPYRI